MDLNMAISEKVSYIQNSVLNYNLQLQPSHIKLNFFHLLLCFSCRPTYTYEFYPVKCFYRNLDYIRITRILTLPSQLFAKDVHPHLSLLYHNLWDNLMFIQNGLKRLSQIHESIWVLNIPLTTTRHQCTRNENGWYQIHGILCIVGLYSIFSNLYHCLPYYISYSLHKNLVFVTTNTFK